MHRLTGDRQVCSSVVSHGFVVWVASRTKPPFVAVYW
jgi:hypothetical protein